MSRIVVLLSSRASSFAFVLSLFLTCCGSTLEEDIGVGSVESTGGTSAAATGGGGVTQNGTGGTGASVAGTGGVPASGGGVSMATGGDGASSGGDGSGGSASGGSGTQTGFSSNRDDFGLGAESLCSDALTVCESFETTSLGNLPGGFALSGYGNRTVGVTESQSARGARSLQIDVPGGQGAVVSMLRLNDLGELGSGHFGRMFYRIEAPGPSEFIHFDVLEAVGPWMGHENGVRFASTGTGVGTNSSNWSWIYNVQPFGTGAGAEFGSDGDRSAHPQVGEWMCLEWEFEASGQAATYYHDGSVIDYLVIDTERSEIPVFTEIGIGLQKFQTTGALRVWVDEVALNSSRIGCNY